MKITIIFLSMFLLVSFAANKPHQSFQQLFSLAGGTWVMKTKNGTLCEKWKKVNNNLLSSQSYKTTGSDTTLMETVQLSRNGNDIYYTPTVPDQNAAKPVSFKLVESKNDEFIFSNPEHDFPQRIVYQLVSKDSLHAWIDGKYNGKEIKKDYYYRRVM